MESPYRFDDARCLLALGEQITRRGVVFFHLPHDLFARADALFELGCEVCFDARYRLPHGLRFEKLAGARILNCSFCPGHDPLHCLIRLRRIAP